MLHASRNARAAAATAVLMMTLAGCPGDQEQRSDQDRAPGANGIMTYDPEELPVEEAVLGWAPEVAPPIQRDHPARVVVEMTATEHVGHLAEGVEYEFWTFGDSVPGPMVRVRQGDYVEFHLVNHEDSKVPHNIDLHSVKGPGGGAEATFVAPGERASFSFQATRPGTYIYHCATPPVGLHVANGMYGVIVVEPPGGFPPVDREFYVVQSEFYTEGDFGERGLQPFSMERALREDPGYVVFNGAVGSLTGANAMQARVGETVRIFIGNGGPNLVSSFHVIGEILERVYLQGGTTIVENVETTLVPAGGTAIVEFTLQVPADYILVDHSIFRAFNKGALGILTAVGDENPLVFEEGAGGLPADGVYPGLIDPRKYVEEAAARPEPESEEPLTEQQMMESGVALYRHHCASCHMPDGSGVAGTFPAMTDSRVLADDENAIRNVLRGARGEVTVMPPFAHLSDQEIASVLTYARQSFGNNFGSITPDQVAEIRNE